MLIESVRNQNAQVQSVQSQNVQRKEPQGNFSSDQAMAAQGGAVQVKTATVTTTQELDEKKIKAALDEANNRLKQTRTRCEFAYHDETNRISIKVIDKNTNELVREIPPEKTLEMLEKIWEIAGLLVDEKC